MTIIDNNNKEIKCLIEEIDCQSSINALRYKEPTFIEQDIPNGKGIETVDEFEIQNHVEDHSTDKLPLEDIIDTVPDRNCVVEEVDCKKSLISIGYQHSEEEKAATVDGKETIHLYDSKTSVETLEPIEDVSAKDVTDATAAQLQIDYSKLLDISKFFSEFDINKFLSSSIIASVVDYTADNNASKDKDEKAKEIEKDANLINTEGMETGEGIEINGEMETKEEMESIEGVETIEEMERTEEVETKEEMESTKEMETSEGMETSNSIEAGMDLKNRSNIFQRSNFLKGEWAKKVLHTGEMHLENKIGFISLLSVLGFVGIFTDTRACLGFFGFLYFIRYFYFVRDDNFKGGILKASKVGFFTSIFISTFTIVLWLLIDKVLIFSLGLSIGMAVSVIVFAIILEMCIKKRLK